MNRLQSLIPALGKGLVAVAIVSLTIPSLANGAARCLAISVGELRPRRFVLCFGPHRQFGPLVYNRFSSQRQ